MLGKARDMPPRNTDSSVGWCAAHVERIKYETSSITFHSMPISFSQPKHFEWMPCTLALHSQFTWPVCRDDAYGEPNIILQNVGAPETAFDRSKNAHCPHPFDHPFGTADCHGKLKQTKIPITLHSLNNHHTSKPPPPNLGRGGLGR